MAAVTRLLAATAVLVSGAAEGQGTRAWMPEIAEASARFAIPAAWIERVMDVESGGRTSWHGRPIVSAAGAMGLMQIMPSTWQSLRARFDLGDDPFAPRANIMGGAAYLREMFDRFGYPGLFGAYNAGPARYAAFVSGRRPLPSETVAYLAHAQSERPRVMSIVPQPRQWRTGLFFKLTGWQGKIGPATRNPLFIMTSARNPGAETGAANLIE